MLRWIRESRTIVAADLLLVMGRGRGKGPREGAGADSRQEVQRVQARFLCALSFSRVRVRTISRRLGGAGRAGFVSRVRTVSRELRQPKREVRHDEAHGRNLARAQTPNRVGSSSQQSVRTDANGRGAIEEENAPSEMNVRIGGEALGRGGRDSIG